MKPFFVLLMMISLLLPAAPVSGCECGSNQSTASNKNCCCSVSTSEQIQKQKNCCCQSTQQRKQKGTSANKQIQFQNPGCHCQRTVMHPVIIASIRPVELTEKLSGLINSVALSSDLSLLNCNANSPNLENSHPGRSFSAGEFCAHFCLWLI